MQFKFPFTCIVAGMSKSGKSEWTKKVILSADTLIAPAPERIIYAYSEYQDFFSLLPAHIELVQGLPDLDELKTDPRRKLLVLDDLMHVLAKQKNSQLVDLFTKGSHHWSLAVIHLVQNLYYENMRTARINSHYLVLMKSPSDKLQAINLSRQLYPGEHKFFLEAYKDACSKPFGYLLIDNEPTTDDSHRLRTSIFPGEQCIVYVRK